MLPVAMFVSLAKMLLTTRHFQAVCGSCHNISLVAGIRMESEWIEELQQMVKIGEKGTDEQFDRVMRVLLRTLTSVNVNIATEARIVSVLGVSEATAAALVKWRQRNGNFKTLEDLKKVPGVSPAKLDARRERITF